MSVVEVICGLREGNDFPTLSYFWDLCLVHVRASVQVYRQVTLKAIINHPRIFSNLNAIYLQHFSTVIRMK